MIDRFILFMIDRFILFFPTEKTHLEFPVVAFTGRHAPPMSSKPFSAAEPEDRRARVDVC